MTKLEDVKVNDKIVIWLQGLDGLHYIIHDITQSMLTASHIIIGTNKYWKSNGLPVNQRKNRGQHITLYDNDAKLKIETLKGGNK